MRLVSPSSALWAFVVLLGCTSNAFRDPSCQPMGDPPNADVTLGLVALFREDGSPIELPSAVVSCTQGAAVFGRAQYRPEFGLGAVLQNGAVRVVMGEAILLNSYTCGLSGGGPILRRCSEPLRVRVEAPGCEPYERSFTWDENFDLNGPHQTSFQVPVRLRCSGDAGADPSMRDVPAANRDSGTTADVSATL
jgi:hypothetical protein